MSGEGEDPHKERLPHGQHPSPPHHSHPHHHHHHREPILAAPKPQRSHVDLFSMVEQHLRDTPSPVLRQSSPHLNNPAINAIVLQGILEACKSGSGSGHSSPTNEGPLALLEHTASPFLGETLSVHQGAYDPTYNQSKRFEQPQNKLMVDGMGILRMPRAQSLEGLLSTASELPCMIKMPRTQAFSELGDSFETIPSKSWILPYIIACCPPVLLQQLVYLPKLIQPMEKGVAASGISNKSTGVMPQAQDLPIYDSSIEEDCFVTRPRIASDTDSTLRPNDLAHAQMQSFYQHKSFSSRPPFAPQSSSRPGSSDPYHALNRPSQTAAMMMSPNLAGEVISSSSRTSSPAAQPFIVFPSSWRSLGVLLLSKDPSWRSWEPKTVYLIDNYIFEATEDGSKIIGFAQLCGAKIKKCPFTDPHGRSHRHSPGIADLADWNSGFVRKEDLSYGLVVSCSTCSERTSPQVQFWITTAQLQDLDILYSALTRASRLRVEDVFALPDLPEKEGLLGRGQCSQSRHELNELSLSNCFFPHWVINRSI